MGDGINEKSRIDIGIFAKMCNKILITTQNNNLIIGMNASM
jgi:hypothetical protein